MQASQLPRKIMEGCNANYRAWCIDTHTCGSKTVYFRYMSHVLSKWSAQIWSYFVCCMRNGLGLILVCLGEGNTEAKVEILGTKVALQQLCMQQTPSMSLKLGQNVDLSSTLPHLGNQPTGSRFMVCPCDTRYCLTCRAHCR